MCCGVTAELNEDIVFISFDFRIIY